MGSLWLHRIIHGQCCQFFAENGKEAQMNESWQPALSLVHHKHLFNVFCFQVADHGKQNKTSSSCKCRSKKKSSESPAFFHVEAVAARARKRKRIVFCHPEVVFCFRFRFFLFFCASPLTETNFLHLCANFHIFRRTCETLRSIILLFHSLSSSLVDRLHLHLAIKGTSVTELPTC